MKVFFATIFLLLCLTAAGLSQAEVQVPPAPTFESYRPVGETRLWSFEIKQQNVGRLISTVTKKTEIDDQPAFVINERLDLDFRPSGSDLSIQISGDQFVSPQGHYLGTEQQQTINEQTSLMKASLKGAIIDAVTTSGGRETKQTLTLDPAGFVYDLFFLDQIELFFAMKGIRVGEIYADTFFSPQPMITTVFNGMVVDFVWQGLYTGHYDSVFIVNVSSPEPARLMFTKNYRLVKADFLGRNLKVYLDAVRQVSGSQAGQTPKLTLARFMMLVPVIGIYLTIAGLMLMLLGWDGFKLEEPYIALLFGAVLFAVVPLVQHPVQNWLIKGIVAPQGQSQTIWLSAALPGVAAALLQTVVVAGAVLLLRKFRKFSDVSPVVLGAFIGSGFGVAEASYLSLFAPGDSLYSWGLIEKAAFITFHTAAGALIGRGVAAGSTRLLQFSLLAFAMNALLRYSPILVQQRILQLQLLHILLALVVLVFLVVALVLVRQRRPSRVAQPAAKQPTR